MATDIAMAVGVLSLLGARVVPSLRLFLLALAIVDDIGAILVIAVFYSDDIDLVGAGRGRRHRASSSASPGGSASSRSPVYVVLGAGLWLCLHESGIHATLTGVILGLMAPTRPMRHRELIDADELRRLTVERARSTVTTARRSVSVVEWLEHLLHPWTSFVIVPLFALANAGVPVTVGRARRRRRRRRSRTASSSGSSSASSSASRRSRGWPPGWASASCHRARRGRASSASARWPASASRCRCSSPALAFDDVVRQDEAKIGILAASLIAAVLGSVLLSRVGGRAAPDLVAGGDGRPS